jgi:tRNA-2-methylthio-N6-dimethylallyladenosine synthase
VEHNAFARNQRKVGGVEEVYVRHGSTEDGKAIGETWSGHAVHVRADVARPGDYVRARIDAAGPHVLYAGESIA